MEELIKPIFKYVVENGGIYGLLLAIALSWIVFREKYLWKNKSKESENKKTENEIDKILIVLDHLKEHQKENFEQIIPLIEQVKNLHYQVEDKIEDLYKWHAVFDDEGVPIWYVRKSIVESISSLEDTISLLQVKFTQAHDTLKVDLVSKLQKVNDKRVDELKDLLENYNKTITELTIALEKIKSLLNTGDKNA